MSEQSFICRDASHHSHYRLNHPPPSPPPALIRGKIVSHETGPWCQKGWGPLLPGSAQVCSSGPPLAVLSCSPVLFSSPPPLHCSSWQISKG